MNTKKQKKIILGIAQHYGFGAFSYLFSITRAVRKKATKDYKYNLLETKNVDIFYKRNLDVFDNLISTNKYSQSETPAFLNNLTETRQQINHIISSFEPYVIFYAWFYNIPNSFFTDLFWFWDINTLKPEINTHLNKLSKLKETNNYCEALAYFHALGCKNHHHTMFIAYFLSQQNYVLQAEGVEERLAALPSIKKKTILLPGIVNIPEHIDPLPNNERNLILIQLAGSTAPTISTKQNVRFAQNILSLMCEIASSNKTKNLQWRMIINPIILNEILRNNNIKLPKNFTLTETVSQEENFQLMARSKAIFMSPTTGAYEASVLKTPIFLLSEQNGGQPATYHKLLQRGFSHEDNITICEMLNLDLSGDSPKQINRIYENHEIILNGKLKHKAKNRIKQFLDKLKDITIRQKIINTQYIGFKKAMNGFNGLEIMSNHITKRLK